MQWNVSFTAADWCHTLVSSAVNPACHKRRDRASRELRSVTQRHAERRKVTRLRDATMVSMLDVNDPVLLRKQGLLLVDNT